jgi:methionyl aminopeptidase
MIIKTSDEIKKMAKAGVVVKGILQDLSSLTSPGMTTQDIDSLCREMISHRNAHPTILNYHGFPASLCVSVNEEIIHGIPGSRVIHAGDLVSLDLAAAVEGYNADSAITFVVGTSVPTREVTRLLKGTKTALAAGIAQAVPGNRIGDISNAIQMVAEEHGLALIPEFGGHGLGREMHELPFISNVGLPHTGELIQEGLCLAIEPMVLLGLGGFTVMPDNWTVTSLDGSLSAHFEHTIVVTKDGPVILT